MIIIFCSSIKQTPRKTRGEQIWHFFAQCVRTHLTKQYICDIICPVNSGWLESPLYPIAIDVGSINCRGYLFLKLPALSAKLGRAVFLYQRTAKTRIKNKKTHSPTCKSKWIRLVLYRTRERVATPVLISSFGSVPVLSHTVGRRFPRVKHMTVAFRLSRSLMGGDDGTYVRPHGAMPCPTY